MIFEQQDVGVCCRDGCTKGNGGGAGGVASGGGGCASNFNGIAVLAGHDVSTTNGAPLAEWGGFGNGVPARQPKWMTGDNGFAHFSRGSRQYLEGGEMQFNLQSGGGFTAVMVVKFSSSRGNWERIFDFGNGAERGNILFARCGGGTGVGFYIKRMGGGHLCGGCTGGVINPNAWQTYVVRYNAASNTFNMMVDGRYIYGNSHCHGRPEDRTLKRTYIARSNWNSDAYLDGDIKGIYLSDGYLANADTQRIGEALMYSSSVKMNGCTGSQFGDEVRLWGCEDGCCRVGAYVSLAFYDIMRAKTRRCGHFCDTRR